VNPRPKLLKVIETVMRDRRSDRIAHKHVTAFRSPSDLPNILWCQPGTLAKRRAASARQQMEVADDYG
jgi:hypothetical protein